MGLVDNLLETSTYEGDIYFYAYDQSINLQGKVRLLNEEQISLSLDISGHIENTPLHVKFTFINNTLFCEYDNLKLYCSTSDAMDIITQIMAQSNTSIESVIDMSKIQNMLNNITTEEYQNGSITRVTLPILNEVILKTDQNSFPTSLEANNIKVNNNTYCFKVFM